MFAFICYQILKSLGNHTGTSIGTIICCNIQIGNFAKFLLKDNHIGAAGGVKEAVKMAKAYAPFVRKIEVEVETFEMVQDAVESGADIIMLDNMDNDLLKQSIDYIAGRAEIEISGNVTKENIERIKNFGVNYVSSGALTHSAPILDISLKNLHAV